MDWLYVFVSSPLAGNILKALHHLEPFIVMGGLWLIWRRLKKARSELGQTVDKLSSQTGELGFQTDQLRADTSALGASVGQAHTAIADFGVRLDTLKELVSSLQQTLETALGDIATTQSNDSDAADNWDQVRAIWQETRERIEVAIDSISSKQRRARYSKFDRYSYQSIIAQLQIDGSIPSSTFAALVQMNANFNRLRAKPGNATAADASNFTSWRSAINSSLPKLPVSDIGMAAPTLFPIEKSGNGTTAQSQH